MVGNSLQGNMRLFLGGNESVLHLDCGGGHTTVCICEKSLNCIRKTLE